MKVGSAGVGVAGSPLLGGLEAWSSLVIVVAEIVGGGYSSVDAGEAPKRAAPASSPAASRKAENERRGREVM